MILADYGKINKLQLVLRKEQFLSFIWRLPQERRTYILYISFKYIPVQERYRYHILEETWTSISIPKFYREDVIP